MPLPEQIAVDYQTTRLSLKGHPMGMLRGLFAAQRVASSAEVRAMRDGAFVRTIGSKGSDDGQFGVGTCGLAFDSEGNLVVADCCNHRVQVLRYSDGAHVRTIGSEGSGNGQFNYPRGIAVDGEGNVAVFDHNNARVQVHRLSDGAYIRTIGSASKTPNREFQPTNRCPASKIATPWLIWSKECGEGGLVEFE